MGALGEMVRSVRGEPAIDGMTLLAPALAVDPAAVTEIELFAECLFRGFSEVLALHGGSRAPVPLR